MDQFLDAPREGSGTAALLGPAVSPREGRVLLDAGSPPKPFPPFVARRWDAAPESETVVSELTSEPAPDLAPEEGLLDAASTELPLLESAAHLVGDDLGLIRGAEWEAEAEDALDAEIEELLREHSAAHPESAVLEAQFTEAELPPRESVPEPVPSQAEAPEVTTEEWALAAVPDAERNPADAPEPSPVQGGRNLLEEAMQQLGTPAPWAGAAVGKVDGVGQAPALQEIAGRLERIAHALREGRPIELFASGASDPLEVLIAGYALGYSEAFRRVDEERRRAEG